LANWQIKKYREVAAVGIDAVLRHRYSVMVVPPKRGTEDRDVCFASASGSQAEG
jgi:hypothetical protein